MDDEKRFCEVCETLVAEEQYLDHVDEHVAAYVRRTDDVPQSRGAYVWKAVVDELNPAYEWEVCPGCGALSETLQRPDAAINLCLACRTRAENHGGQDLQRWTE